MSIKVKNQELMGAARWLSKLNGDEFSIRFAFAISTLVNRVNVALKVCEEMRQKIIKDYPEKDKDGNIVFVDDKKQFLKLTDEGMKRLTELMEIEVDIDVEQLTYQQLEDNNVKVRPADLEPLKWLLKP